jgi:hypothetical protein
MGQFGRFDKSRPTNRRYQAAWRGRVATVTIAIRLNAATSRNTSFGLPWSMMAPKISGEIMPPILKPVVTLPRRAA